MGILLKSGQPKYTINNPQDAFQIADSALAKIANNEGKQDELEYLIKVLNKSIELDPDITPEKRQIVGRSIVALCDIRSDLAEVRKIIQQYWEMPNG